MYVGDGAGRRPRPVMPLASLPGTGSAAPSCGPGGRLASCCQVPAPPACAGAAVALAAFTPPPPTSQLLQPHRGSPHLPRRRRRLLLHPRRRALLTGGALGPLPLPRFPIFSASTSASRRRCPFQPIRVSDPSSRRAGAQVQDLRKWSGTDGFSFFLRRFRARPGSRNGSGSGREEGFSSLRTARSQRLMKINDV